MNRRNFLSTVSSAASAPLFVPSNVLGMGGKPGANSRIQVGFIGVGGRARWLLTYFDMPEAQLVAVADCYLTRMDEAAAKHPQGGKWRKYHDYRKMLEKEKLDAVFVETTTHARVADQHPRACRRAWTSTRKSRCAHHRRRTHRWSRPPASTTASCRSARSSARCPSTSTPASWCAKAPSARSQEVIACNFEPPESPGSPSRRSPCQRAWTGTSGATRPSCGPITTTCTPSWGLWWDYDGGGQSWGVTGWGTHALDQVQCALGTDDTGPVEIWPEEKGEQARVTMRYANGTLLKLQAAQDQRPRAARRHLRRRQGTHPDPAGQLPSPTRVELRRNAPEDTARRRRARPLRT